MSGDENKTPSFEDVNKGRARWTVCVCGHLAQDHSADGYCQHITGGIIMCDCEQYTGKIIWRYNHASE